MIWHLLKYWIAFIIPAFYKRIQGKNLKNIRVKGPVIIAMNHPNAFSDPVVFTNIAYPLRLKHLARGDAFKPGLAAWLLEQIGIVPIYRIQDGGLEGLKKNEEAYRRVNHLLKKNSKIIVFAEGICVQERRLRPLKKGVARMVFGAYESLPQDNLTVVPIGVNYSNPSRFGSTVFFNVGEPIAVKDFIGLYRENPARANNLFLQNLEPKMRELITHIRDKNYDETVYRAETLFKRSYLQSQDLDFKNLEHDFLVTKQITERINTAVETNPLVAEEFKAEAAHYFQRLKQNKLEDWLLDPAQNKCVNRTGLLAGYVLLLLGFPLYAFGMLGHYPSYLLTKTLTKKILKQNLEFYSSIFMGLAMVIFLLTYLFWFTLAFVFSPNILQPFVICSILALSAAFTVYYHPFKHKVAEIARSLKQKELCRSLSQQRLSLIQLFNKL